MSDQRNRANAPIAAIPVATPVAEPVDVLEEVQPIQPWKLAAILVACIAGALGLVVAGATAHTPKTDLKVLKGIGGFFLLAAIGGGVACWLGVASRCPKCKWWWKDDKVATKKAGEDHAYKTVTRRDKTDAAGVAFGSGWGIGLGSATTNRQEQVIVKRTYFETLFRCSHCKHEWTKTTSKETENFTIPTK